MRLLSAPSVLQLNNETSTALEIPSCKNFIVSLRLYNIVSSREPSKVLKNVARGGQARRKSAKKRSLHKVYRYATPHFSTVSNAASSPRITNDLVGVVYQLSQMASSFISSFSVSYTHLTLPTIYSV